MTKDEVDFGVTGRPGRTRHNPQKGVGRHKWRSNTLGVVDMADMSDDHLIAAVKTCDILGNPGKKTDLVAELTRRGCAHLLGDRATAAARLGEALKKKFLTRP